MDIQILPNWFKKVAVILFVISTLLSGADDFIAGWHEGVRQGNKNNSIAEMYEKSNHNNYYFTNMIGGKEVTHWFGVLASLALLTYLLSKEKIEDDYIKLLRLESYQLSFIIVTIIALFYYLFNKELFFGIADSVNILMLLYLVIFYFKKQLV